jgi:hypothetical protein
MQNPIVQFPFVTQTPNGDLIHSGVMPHFSGRWSVVAYCPAADGNRIRTTQYVQFSTYEEAVEAAQTKPPHWFRTVGIEAA